MAGEKRLLMVCLGNICRSPIAHGVMENLIARHKLPFKVDSCGTAGYHVGEAPDKRAIRVAQEFGVDISRQRARKLSKLDFESMQYIFAMDRSNLLAIQSFPRGPSFNGSPAINLLTYALPEPATNCDVPDPYYGNVKDFYSVFNLCLRACEAVLNDLMKHA